MEDDPQEDAGRDPVPAISRAAALLDLLAASDSGGMSVGALARSLGLARSSTANLCTSLATAGFVVANGSQYRLGHRLLDLGASYLAKVDQVQRFYEQCASSTRLSKETVRLSVLDGTTVLYLARYDGARPLRLTAAVGDRYPASVTATGKAILATLPVEDVRARFAGVELTAFTEASVTRFEDLEVEIARTRERGYAIDDEETTPGVVCFAIPVTPGQDGRARLGISVTLQKARDSDETRTGLVDELRRVASGIGATLGEPYPVG